MARLSFNAVAVDPAHNFGVLPPGKYLTIVTNSEIKETAARTGQYLQLEHTVIDGPNKGRKVWDRLNIVNQNKTAEEIAHRTLSSICRIVGVMNLQDSAELHNKPMLIELSVEKRNDNGEDQNRVKGYYFPDGRSPADVAKGISAVGDSAPAANAPSAVSLPPGNATPTTGERRAQSATPPWKK